MTETTTDPGTPTTEVTLGSRTLDVPAGGCSIVIACRPTYNDASPRSPSDQCRFLPQPAQGGSGVQHWPDVHPQLLLRDVECPSDNACTDKRPARSIAFVFGSIGSRSRFRPRVRPALSATTSPTSTSTPRLQSASRSNRRAMGRSVQSTSSLH